MNRDRFEGMWTQLGGILREWWGMPTSDQVSVVAGRHDQLAGRAQEQYGMKKEEAQHQLRDFLHRNRRWGSPSR